MNRVVMIMGAVMASSLIGCSGGSSGSNGTITPSSPTAPTNVALTTSGKSLDFSWSASTDVDHYRILVNPDGASGFTVDPAAATIAATATSHSIEIPVHKVNWLSAQYIVEACDAAETNCASSPNQTLALIDSVAATVYAKASNTEANDRFSLAVSLSGDGNTLAVGAGLESSAATGIDGDQANNSAIFSGAVYVFTRTGTSWAQQAYIKSSSPDASDEFGSRVAISDDGNTLAVGAGGEDSAATGIDGNHADNAANLSGAVYIFTRSGTVWAQQAYVKASNTEANDNFSYSISLSGDGNTLAVGANGEDSAATGVEGNQADNTASASGAVYVFTRTGTSWLQQAYVKASNTEQNDQFGSMVSLSGDGNTMAIGARAEASAATGIGGNQADNSAALSGAVYVFSRSGTVWTQQAYVKASNSEAGDDFGIALSLSSDGNTLAVGANSEDSAATGVAGNQADNTASASGAVYVFTRTGTSWLQQAYVKASNTGAIDNFGYPVSLSGDGNTLAVGAHSEDSAAMGIDGDQADNTAPNAGAVYVFSRTGTTWAQQNYVKASNAEAGEYFGYSVSLSHDGDTLAVGAHSEDSAATGIGGDQADNTTSDSGAVYLY